MFCALVVLCPFFLLCFMSCCVLCVCCVSCFAQFCQKSIDAQKPSLAKLYNTFVRSPKQLGQIDKETDNQTYRVRSNIFNSYPLWRKSLKIMSVDEATAIIVFIQKFFAKFILDSCIQHAAWNILFVYYYPVNCVSSPGPCSVLSNTGVRLFG